MSKVSNNEVLSALSNLFDINQSDIEMNIDKKSDIYLIKNITINMTDYEFVYIGCKKITSGGGDNSDSRAKNERRIQIKSSSVNYLFEKIQDGHQAILIGYDDSDSSNVIFSAFNIIKSQAKNDNPISFQVKQETINSARLIGFYQQDRSKSFACVFRKEFFVFYFENRNFLHNFSLKESNSSINHTSINHNNIIGKNILFYGVAGVGKSHTIDIITGKNESFIERIVFHSDYLNTDFVGQIMPTMQNGQIVYDFKAGSFTKILKKAIDDPNNHYYLVIEEINRGNAPAIFGEIFQLLDRNNNGESSYRISHEMIANEVFKEKYGDKAKDKAIYIPNNLSILATMNTADQNVFTLDTAFQRRWTMRMIENNIQNCDYKDDEILDTGITWERFNTVINNFILQTNKDSLSSEDKRLGAYFVRQDELKLPENMENGIAFAEKVIKYLWDDVFKFNKSVLFDSQLNALDKALNVFKNNTGFARFEIFNEDIRNQLKQG